MRILHILSTPRAEGTPNLVLDWLELSECEQEVFALHRTPADLTDRLQQRAAWYGESELLAGRGLGKFLRIVRAVRDVCLARRPDLVICWPAGLANWAVVGVRLALGWRPRFIVHCGNPPNRGSDWISYMVLLPVWLAGGKCACCSIYVRDLYRGITLLPGRLFTAIYNCVRVPMIQARARVARAARDTRAGACEINAIMVATMEAHKDHATLLQALPIVLAAYPGFRIRLIGDGSLRGELEAQTEQLGLGEIVDFVGASSEVPEWLGRSDLFVFSTTSHEGFGSVLLEALAAGLPIVATDCSACREVLVNGQYGALVKAGDPAALAAEILRAVAFVATYDSQPGIEYAERFTPARMMGEYLQLAGLRDPKRYAF